MTSHIPQLIAYSIVATASELESHLREIGDTSKEVMNLVEKFVTMTNEDISSRNVYLRNVFRLFFISGGSHVAPEQIDELCAIVLTQVPL